MAIQSVRQPARHLLTVHDFHKMGEAGILGEDDRIELIDGELIDMAPIGSLHASIVMRLTSLFAQAMAERAILSPQNPIRLADWSEPQPDIAVLRYRSDFYRDSHPVAEDVLLLVEVADTTLRYDRNIKIPLYARHGVPEVWLVDPNARSLEVHRQPVEEGYRELLRPHDTETVALSELSDISIAVADIWT